MLSSNESSSFLSQSYSWLLISALILIIFCIVSVFGRNAYQVRSFLLELIFNLSLSSGETSNWLLDGSRSNRSLHCNSINSPHEWVKTGHFKMPPSFLVTARFQPLILPIFFVISGELTIRKMNNWYNLVSGIGIIFIYSFHLSWAKFSAAAMHPGITFQIIDCLIHY